MERAPERDDAGPPGHSPGEFQCRLDCFGAGVAEEDCVERIRTGVGQQRGQACDGLEVAEGIADVEQLVGLILDCLCHRGVMVAK